MEAAGIAMGEMEIIKLNTGEKTTYAIDGTIIKEQNPIDGLYAIGESAGFGGGGIHGLRSLEGTFLGTCVLTGRVAANSISK